MGCYNRIVYVVPSTSLLFCTLNCQMYPENSKCATKLVCFWGYFSKLTEGLCEFSVKRKPGGGKVHIFFHFVNCSLQTKSTTKEPD